MHFAWAPTRILSITAAIALLLVVATFYVATQQPWLGIQFKPSAEGTGLEVVSVHPASPNKNSLATGDVIVGFSRDTHEEQFDKKILPIGEADVPTFATFNRYVAHHKALWEILSTHDFDFVLKDGKRVHAKVAQTRPLNDLQWRFLALPIAGFAALMIGIGIAAFRQHLPAAPVIVVGGASMFIATLLAALYVCRELTLPPLWLRFSIEESNPASEMIVFSLAALLWYYPRPLYKFPAAIFFVALVLLFWINELFQLHEFHPHAYMPQYMVSLLLTIVFAIMQWRKTREDALSRAALQWYLLVVIIVNGMFNILSVVPIAYGQPSIIGKADTFFLGPLIYLGLALGVARYRLFDIERWWLEVWLWLAGGLLVLAIDALLLTIFEFTDFLSLGLSLILAGWVYLPLRQAIFRRVQRNSRSRIDDHIPLLIDILFGNSGQKSHALRWQELLSHIFQPLSIRTMGLIVPQSKLLESGLALQVPAFNGEEVIELRYREHGQKLFSPREATLADSLLAMVHRAAGLWQAYEQSVRAEQHRIMRDLHDDVAARLVSLVHQSRDCEVQTTARETLSSLRQVIYAMDDNKPITLADLLIELQANVRACLHDTSARLHWLEPSSLPDITLSARQRLNLTRAMQEAINNALRHAQPKNITVNCEFINHSLRLQLCNDGTILQPEDWQAGKGLTNIRNRMVELEGSAEWKLIQQNSASQLCCLQLRLPLTQSA